MAERGHYSLIQFVPDRGRAEGANVGVVLVCPSQGRAVVRLSDSDEGPKRRFGSAVLEESRLSFAKDALAHRLREELSRDPSVDALERIGRLEGNALVLMPPRTVVVDDIERVASKLLDDLVTLSAPARKRGERASQPDVGRIIQRLRARGAVIQTPGQVVVPKTQQKLKVAFAYQNGVYNCVHPQGFGRDDNGTVEVAQRLGAQGHLLYKGTESKQKLVVLARFSVKEHQAIVTDICADLEVRVVDEDSADSFIEEVVRSAHA